MIANKLNAMRTNFISFCISSEAKVVSSDQLMRQFDWTEELVNVFMPLVDYRKIYDDGKTYWISPGYYPEFSKQLKGLLS
ncbi:hypothetical protein [Geomonas propionica]|uniref:Winged helix-turn-helix domain-containing protein n=1 Tax=Geomonas propionica TaxID=2798582 RepID=A0ABS0YN60_9BACT|nr:hypothetical protein [Geomonas propionica]MBJ6799328.1 hypothetical protein [Geomonas propionica]